MEDNSEWTSDASKVDKRRPLVRTFVRPTASSSLLEKPVTDLPFTRYSPSTLTFAKPTPSINTVSDASPSWDVHGTGSLVLLRTGSGKDQRGAYRWDHGTRRTRSCRSSKPS